MYRHALTDTQWARLRPLLPQRLPHAPGRPPKDHRLMVDGCLWIVKTGAPWRDLPHRFGPWETVYYRFNRWRKDGLWLRVLGELLDHHAQTGRLDRSLFCVDASVIRAHKAAAGAGNQSIRINPLEPEDHALGRSQGGWGSKVHLLCDGQGQPLGVILTPGQRHESVAFETVLATAGELQPEAVAGDKAYSAQRIRNHLIGRKITPVIPTRADEERQADFDREKYRRRNVVERLVGVLKECRRLATRYEKLAVNFLAMIHLGMIRFYLGRRRFPNTA